MIPIVAGKCRAAPDNMCGCEPAQVVHILTGVEKRLGARPVMAVGDGGAVVIPKVYLAMMGLGDGGCIRFTVVQGGVAIERAEWPDPAG